MTDGPKRLSRKRAHALLDLVKSGYERQRRIFEQAYGLKLTLDDDGNLTVDSELAELMEPGRLAGMKGHLSDLRDALAAAEIIANRYP